MPVTVRPFKSYIRTALRFCFTCLTNFASTVFHFVSVTLYSLNNLDFNLAILYVNGSSVSPHPFTLETRIFCAPGGAELGDKDKIRVGSWLSLCSLIPAHWLGRGVVRPQFPGWEWDKSKEYAQLGIFSIVTYLHVIQGLEMSEISSTVWVQLMQTSELCHTGYLPQKDMGEPGQVPLGCSQRPERPHAGKKPQVAADCKNTATTPFIDLFQGCLVLLKKLFSAHMMQQFSAWVVMDVSPIQFLMKNIFSFLGYLL